MKFNSLSFVPVTDLNLTVPYAELTHNAFEPAGCDTYDEVQDAVTVFLDQSPNRRDDVNGGEHALLTIYTRGDGGSYVAITYSR